MAKATPPTAGGAKRAKADWEAIERDYRTGKFTLRELEAKHGVSYSQISRKATAEGWEKDLRSVVRQATKAAVLRETTTKAQNAATDVVLANAEIGKQVILGDRMRIGKASTLAMDMLHELTAATHSQEELAGLLRQASKGLDAGSKAAVQQSFKDLLRLHSRVGSMQKLSDVLTRLQAMERKAFDLDGDERPGDDIVELTDADLDARINQHLERLNKSLAG